MCGNVCAPTRESLTSISEFDLRVYERKNYSDLGLRDACVLKQRRKGRTVARACISNL